MSGEIYKKTIAGIYVYERLSPEDAEELEKILIREKSRAYDKILLNPRKLLKKIPKDLEMPRTYRCMLIPEPQASRLRQGLEKSVVLDWGTRYRGTIVLVAPKYPLGACSGRIFAMARIRTVQRERGAFRWYFNKVESKDDWFAIVDDPKRGFFRLTFKEGLE